MRKKKQLTVPSVCTYDYLFFPNGDSLLNLLKVVKYQTTLLPVCRARVGIILSVSVLFWIFWVIFLFALTQLRKLHCIHVNSSDSDGRLPNLGDQKNPSLSVLAIYRFYVSEFRLSEIQYTFEHVQKYTIFVYIYAISNLKMHSS